MSEPKPADPLPRRAIRIKFNTTNRALRAVVVDETGARRQVTIEKPTDQAASEEDLARIKKLVASSRRFTQVPGMEDDCVVFCRDDTPQGQQLLQSLF